MTDRSKAPLEEALLNALSSLLDDGVAPASGLARAARSADPTASSSPVPSAVDQGGRGTTRPPSFLTDRVGAQQLGQSVERRATAANGGAGAEVSPADEPMVHRSERVEARAPLVDAAGPDRPPPPAHRDRPVERTEAGGAPSAARRSILGGVSAAGRRSGEPLVVGDDRSDDDWSDGGDWSDGRGWVEREQGPPTAPTPAIGIDRTLADGPAPTVQQADDGSGVTSPAAPAPHTARLGGGPWFGADGDAAVLHHDDRRATAGHGPDPEAEPGHQDDDGYRNEVAMSRPERRGRRRRHLTSVPDPASDRVPARIDVGLDRSEPEPGPSGAVTPQPTPSDQAGRGSNRAGSHWNGYAGGPARRPSTGTALPGPLGAPTRPATGPDDEPGSPAAGPEMAAPGDGPEDGGPVVVVNDDDADRLFGEPRAAMRDRALTARSSPAAPPVPAAPPAPADTDTDTDGGHIELVEPVPTPASTPSARPTRTRPGVELTTVGPSTAEHRLGEPPSLDFIVSQESVVDGVAVTLHDPVTDRPELVYVSDNLAALVGRPPEELLGRPLAVLFGADAPDRQLERVAAELAAGCQVEASHVFRHRSGRAVAVHATHCAVPSPPGIGADQRVLLVRDLSRLSGEELLGDTSPLSRSLALGQDLGALCHQVASHAEARLAGGGRCWIGVIDLEGHLEAVVTGGQDLDLVGETLRRVMASGDPTAARYVRVDNLPRTVADPLTADEVRALWAFPAVDHDGRPRGALVVAHQGEALPTEDQVRFLDQLADVVAVGIDRAEAEADLAHQALHDPLTRLPNRALILDRLEQAMARLDREEASLAVLLVDIDRFKALNDTWGPDVGDRVLIEVASRLLASVRLGDTVGRVSSDQFLMLCLADAELDASMLAGRVVRTLQEPVVLADGQELRITASLGVVTVESPGTAATTVIGNAESALASAVRAGRGTFALFDPDQRQAAQARQELEQALRAALGNEEFVVHYQPVCEVRTGRMIGAEALVRWNRPGHGLLGPGHFIALAEETGLIVPLGAWLIDRVAADLAVWPRSSGLWPVVTVNLSARQLSDPGLVATVREALGRHQLPPIRMGFEVTESMRIDDVEAAVETLSQLAGEGCRIAVDDFGIGHATLDYLRRFSMAYALKLDRSFVAGLGRSREDTAIVTATMALAEALDLRVVAEGVESFAQLDLLAELGCSYAQGFALSTPVPLSAALQLWAEGRLFDPGRRPHGS